MNTLQLLTRWSECRSEYVSSLHRRSTGRGRPVEGLASLVVALLLLVGWAIGPPVVGAQSSGDDIASDERPAHVEQAQAPSNAPSNAPEVPRSARETGLPRLPILQLQLEEGGEGVLPSEFDVRGNQAVIQQSGRDNTAEIRQHGRNNLAFVVHEGVGNLTTVRQQGASNLAGIRLRGSENAVDLLQRGQRNRYLLDVTGSGLNLTGPSRIEQIGNDNLLIQQGPAERFFNVRQQANGMRMVIRHE